MKRKYEKPTVLKKGRLDRITAVPSKVAWDAP